MKELGSISGKLQREVEILRELNNALLVVSANTLEKSSEFGFSSDDVSKSRQYLIEFSIRLSTVLKQQSPSVDLQPIIHHLKSGMKPIDDWIEDLENLSKHLKSDEKPTVDTLAILEDILSLLDVEFTEDLQRLYAR